MGSKTKQIYKRGKKYLQSASGIFRFRVTKGVFFLIFGDFPLRQFIIRRYFSLCVLFYVSYGVKKKLEQGYEG